MNNQTTHPPQYRFSIAEIQKKNGDQIDPNDLISKKLQEQVILMKKRQEELLKELEEIDKNPLSFVVQNENIKPNEQQNQQQEKQVVAPKNIKGSKFNKNMNNRNAREQQILDEQKAKQVVKPEKKEDFSQKVNQMNVKLFEMQQRVKQKEVERIKKDQEEKLFRLKKDKEIIKKQTEKAKAELNMKNNKLKEQVEKAKVVKDCLQQKNKEVLESKQAKELSIRKLESRAIQLDYDLESQIGDMARTDGILSSLKLQIRERDNEIKNLNENIRVENLEYQKLLNDLGEIKKQITKLEFDQNKIRDERERLIKEIEKKNDQNNKKYTSLYEDFLKLESKKSEKQVQISSLKRDLEKKKQKILDLKSDNKIIENKVENNDKLRRKIEKKEKKIFELEAEIESQKKQKRVEIVEKVIERPLVIEKPVIVEKPVLIKEEIRINEPIQLEIVRVKGEINNLSRANNEMVNEIDYWRKKCLDLEDTQKIRQDQIKMNHENEKLIILDKIKGNQANARSISDKINAIYTEIEALIKTNESKNAQLGQCLSDIYNKNKNLESVIMTSTFPAKLNTTY
ncbi:hypothetical protein ABPG72_007289 [Tetrahymena utriculariae]